jgi:hypothetical protein
MAEIKFYAANGLGGAFDIDMAGSGLGFFGSGGFGASVAVGDYQENTYVTDGNGAVQGPQSNNVKWTHANSGELSGGTNLHLLDIPNANATLNPRFTHSTAVKVQNVELRIYDRTSIDVGASGVTTKACELLHPSNTQSGLLGSGESTWTTPAGSGVVLTMAQSPGESGLYAGNGSSSVHEDTRHDFYVILSARPDSIGSKSQYSLYFALEYL